MNKQPQEQTIRDKFGTYTFRRGLIEAYAGYVWRAEKHSKRPHLAHSRRRAALNVAPDVAGGLCRRATQAATVDGNCSMAGK